MDKEPDDVTPETPDAEPTAEELAAFESGFKSVQEGAEEPEPAKPDEKPDSEPPAEPTPTPNEDDQPVTLTKAQLRRLEEATTKIASIDALNTEIRKIHGRIGEFDGRLEKAGAPRKVLAEQLKRISEAGYEDLAGYLADDLSGILASGGEPTSQEEVSKLKTELAELRSRTDTMVMDILSPGWMDKMFAEPVKDGTGKVIDVPFAPEFKEYLDTLPADRRRQIETSTDPKHMSGEIKQYDDWIEKQRKVEKDKAKKQKTLDDAITPKPGAATPDHSTDEAEQAFEAGFKSVRK